MQAVWGRCFGGETHVELRPFLSKKSLQRDLVGLLLRRFGLRLEEFAKLHRSFSFNLQLNRQITTLTQNST